MPIYRGGVSPAFIREGGTGAAAIQAWHNGFLLFDGTVSAIVVGSGSVVTVGAEAGVVSGGAVVDGITAELFLTSLPGIAGAGATAFGATSAIVVDAVAGDTMHGQAVEGQTGELLVASGDGEVVATPANEAVGVAGPVVASGLDGIVSAGSMVDGATGTAVAAGVESVASAGQTADGATGGIAVSSVDGTVASGATAIGSTGAIAVTGAAGDVPVGQTAIGATGAVTIAGQAGTIPQLQASRMDKSGTQTWATSTTWVDITGWTPQAGSTVSGNGLVVVGDGPEAILTATIPFSGGTFPRTHTVRIVRVGDSAVIATGTGVVANAGTCTASAVVPVADGEIYKVQMNGSGSATGNVLATATFTIAAPVVFADDFAGTGVLGSNWETETRATSNGARVSQPQANAIQRVSGAADGANLGSDPQSYAEWATPIPADNHKVYATLPDGCTSGHSATSILLRCATGRTQWVEFTITTTLISIYSFYGGSFHFGSTTGSGTGWATTTNSSVIATMTAGSTIELRAVGTQYTAYINGTEVLTVSIPGVSTSNRMVGMMMQNDMLLPAADGTPPTRLGSWGASTAVAQDDGAGSVM